MMDLGTARALDAINRRFYRAGAMRFDTTRQRPWRGWERLVPDFEQGASRGPLRVLDVGCGNGRFLRFLDSARIAIGRYVGIDRSRELLELAKVVVGGRGALVETGLVSEGLAAIAERAVFDRIVLFGVLHHVPGFERRRALLADCRMRLAPGGTVIATLWRFLDDPGAKVLPWEESVSRAGIAVDPSRLEPGDALLPFSDDATLCRYAHHFDDEEIDRLVTGAGLEPVDRFDADGDGRSNHYLVLRAPRRGSGS
jgi:tRNA (uracil-5-)-methyltransferase TRM9